MPGTNGSLYKIDHTIAPCGRAAARTGKSADGSGLVPPTLHAGYEETPCAVAAYPDYGMEKRRNARADSRVCAVAIVPRVAACVTITAQRSYPIDPARLANARRAFSFKGQR